MAPFSAWLPARSDQAFDLIVNIVGKEDGALRAGLRALERALVDEGYEVLAQRGKLGGQSPYSSIRVRVSTEPASSIGNGCDVLACFDEGANHLQPVTLARGSVVLGETQAIPKLLQVAGPSGVVAYPIPFTDLARALGLDAPAKGLIALGVLARLLGLAPERVRGHLRGRVHRRYFNTGVAYADDHVVKRDVFALDTHGGARPHVMLDAHQAVLLGLGIAACHCGAACMQGSAESLDRWVAGHVAEARQATSSFRNRRLPGVTVYRGTNGKLMTVLGATSLEVLSGDEAMPFSDTHILMAGDLSDAVRLTGLAHRAVLESGDPVWVVVDEILANRRETVSVESLERTSREIRRPHGQAEQSAGRPFGTDWDGERGADIGYLTWGSPQGVVREAVGLCRSFGMNVAGLYPKILRPVPRQDIETFAASVKRLVVVEPDRTKPYTALVKSWTGLEPSTITPEPGCMLTPMDIFMREGLGA